MAIQDRFKHTHRWHFLQVRTEAVEYHPDEDAPAVDLPPGLFYKIEYAYYVCNDCPETDGRPNTIKEVVQVHDRQEEA